MDIQIHDDQTFKNINYTEKKFAVAEYDHCEFINCSFQKSELDNVDFMDCSFTDCNFALAILHNTGMKNIKFSDCKLTGIDFSKCKDFLFAVSFQNCRLDYASFFKKKMKSTLFDDCSIKDVDFSEADLSMSVFNNCDLLNAVFMQTILEKVDFKNAVNYSFDPELNKIKKAKFSSQGIAGLLAKYNIEID
jgi:fluoroquinolone resistance protein